MQAEILTQHHLVELAEVESDPVLSLYFPTVGDDGDARKPPIQLKNLLRDATTQLQAAGRDAAATARWLKPIEDLAEDTKLWQRHGEALAIFHWRSQLRLFRLDRSDTGPHAHVDRRAHVLPLLDPRMTGGRFALLAVSLNRVRLLECSRFTAARLHADDLPVDYASALGQYVDTEKQLQYHSGASHDRGAQSRTAIYHGQGVVGDEAVDRARRVEFCRIIDRAVRRLLRDSDLPLVLAADVPMAATYRQVNRYHPLLNQTVAGNFDHLDDAPLRDKAMPVVERRLAQQLTEATQRFHETPPDGRTCDLEQVLAAATNGRIEQLLVREGEQRRGQVKQCRVRVTNDPNDPDLLNLAACLTLTTKGTALTLNEAQMPSTEPLCAALRY